MKALRCQTWHRAASIIECSELARERKSARLGCQRREVLVLKVLADTVGRERDEGVGRVAAHQRIERGACPSEHTGRFKGAALDVVVADRVIRCPCRALLRQREFAAALAMD